MQVSFLMIDATSSSGVGFLWTKISFHQDSNRIKQVKPTPDLLPLLSQTLPAHPRPLFLPQLVPNLMVLVSWRF